MSCRALAVLVAVVGTGACVATETPYAVDAVAQIAPLGTPDVQIEGPLEILGTGMPPPALGFLRTIAAYGVRVPEEAAPWVRLYLATSCAVPGDPPRLFDDLGALRRVGGETHFFARDVEIGGRAVAIDTETAQAEVSLDPANPRSVFGMIAVVQTPGGDGTLQGPSGPPVPAGGPWLACGVFARP